MKKYDIYNLIDINKRKGFPRTYRFNPFIRWFVILLSMFAITYAVSYIFNYIDSATKTFQKIVPFVIIFFALNSLTRNFYSLNTVLFRQEGLVFKYLGKKSVPISWDQLRKISLYPGKTKALKIEYEGDKTLVITLNFPNLLEIVNAIAEMRPDLEYDDFLKNVILSDKEKEDLRNDNAKA
ncbi:MAG: hypothetical protein WC327_01300 [Candidatus Cloacimonadia bacterium]